MEELIKNKLYDFNGKVRVELAPQIIELDCTDENLEDEITAKHYKLGGRDALGRLIRPANMDESSVKAKRLKKDIKNLAAYEKQRGVFGVVNSGEKMACVDWKAKHVPFLWKVYQMQETEEMGKCKGKNGKTIIEPISRFIKINEFKLKEEALAFAESILKEIK